MAESRNSLEPPQFSVMCGTELGWRAPLWNLVYCQAMPVAPWPLALALALTPVPHPHQVLFGNPEYASPMLSPDGKLLAPNPRPTRTLALR